MAWVDSTARRFDPDAWEGARTSGRHTAPFRGPANSLYGSGDDPPRRPYRSAFSDTVGSRPMEKAVVQQRLADSGVVAVLRSIPEDVIVEVANAIHAGGVTALEVTADAERPAEMIAAIDEDLEGTDALVGAGTVMDAETAREAIDAGAEFVLAPNFEPEVVAACNEAEVVCVPGIMTPTEAVDAMNAGADVLKVFPAATVGPGHISALRGPLGDIPLMPTGGVSAENAAAFFDAGAMAVGAGSALVDYEAIENGDMDAVRERAAEFVRAVETARSD